MAAAQLALSWGFACGLAHIAREGPGKSGDEGVVPGAPHRPTCAQPVPPGNAFPGDLCARTSFGLVVLAGTLSAASAVSSCSSVTCMLMGYAASSVDCSALRLYGSAWSPMVGACALLDCLSGLHLCIALQFLADGNPQSVMQRALSRSAARLCGKHLPVQHFRSGSASMQADAA